MVLGSVFSWAIESMAKGTLTLSGLAAICGMSRFVIIRTAPDTTAESAARFLLEIGGTFGFPKRLRYDNSSQFANHLMTALTTLLSIERRPSVPFNPSSNGVIERGSRRS